jgi:hypothetical protein
MRVPFYRLAASIAIAAGMFLTLAPAPAIADAGSVVFTVQVSGQSAAPAAGTLLLQCNITNNGAFPPVAIRQAVKVGPGATDPFTLSTTYPTGYTWIVNLLAQAPLVAGTFSCEPVTNLPMAGVSYTWASLSCSSYAKTACTNTSVSGSKAKYSVSKLLPGYVGTGAMGTAQDVEGVSLTLAWPTLKSANTGAVLTGDLSGSACTKLNLKSPCRSGSTFAVTVKDGSGVMMKGATVNLSAAYSGIAGGACTVSAASVVTDSTGTASYGMTISGTTRGTCTITASSGVTSDTSKTLVSIP